MLGVHGDQHGGAAGLSARAVAIPQAPVTANAAIVTQRSAAPGSVRVLTVLASQLKDEGCSAAATAHPPTKATKAAAAEIRPHQGTERPTARAGGNQMTPPSGSRLLAAFMMPVPSGSCAQDSAMNTMPPAPR